MKTRDILFIIKMRNEARAALRELGVDFKSVASSAAQAQRNMKDTIEEAGRAGEKVGAASGTGSSGANSLKVVRQNADKLKASMEDLNRTSGYTGKTIQQQLGDTSQYAATKVKAFADEGVDNLDKSLTSLLSSINPVYSATKRLDEGQELLLEGLKKGVISQRTYNENLAILRKRYEEAVEGANNTEDGLNRLGNGAEGAKTRILTLFRALAQGNFAQAAQSASLLGVRLAGLGVVGIAAGAAVAGFTVILGFAVKALEDSKRSVLALENSLTATGRSAAVNREDLKAWIDELARMPGVSKEAAAQVIGSFTSIAGISTPLMQQLTTLSADYAKATGTDIVEASKSLAKSFQSPTEGAKQLDSQMNFLTAEQLENIRTMEAQGRTAEAQAVLFKALQDRIGGLRTNITGLESASNDLGTAWENMKKKLAENDFISIENGYRRLALIARTVAKIIPGGDTQATPPTTRKTPEQEAAERAAAAQVEIKKASELGASYTGVDQKAKQLRNTQIALMNAMGLEASTNGKLTDTYRILEDQFLNVVRAQRALTDQSAVVVAQAEVVFNRQKRANEQATADLENALKNREIGFSAYLARIEVLQGQEIAAQRAQLQKQLEVARQAAAQTEPNTSAAASAQAQIVKLQDQIAALGDQAITNARNNTQALREELIATGKTSNDILASFLEATGQTVEAQALRLGQTYGPIIEKMLADGNEAGAEFVRRLIPLQLAEAQFNQLTDAFNRSISRMNIAEAELRLQNKAGLLTEVELRNRVIDLQKKQAEELEKLIPKLETEANAAAGPAREKLIAQLEALKLKIKELNSAGTELGHTFEFGFRSGAQSYIESIRDMGKAGAELAAGAFRQLEDTIVNAFKTGKLSAKDFFDFMVTELIRLQVRKAIVAASEGINFGTIASAAASIFAFHNGGFAGSATGLQRMIPLAAFAGAARAHQGAIAGLSSGEVPIIAKKNEAIMPTVRLPNGQLGVQSTGGGGGNTFIFQTSVEVNGGGEGRDPAAMKQLGDQIAKSVDMALEEKMAKFTERQGQSGGFMNKGLNV
jgi:phage-related minor tail protein